MLLKGSAALQFEGDDGEMALGPGDALFIPAGVRHRVIRTDDQSETVWLAVHVYSNERS